MTVEHFMPQHRLDGGDYSEEEKKELNTFGNLALITPSANSRQSNSSPKEKANNIALNKPVESLKYELMMQIARLSDSQYGWDIPTCRKHGGDMKELISSYKSPQIPFPIVNSN